MKRIIKISLFVALFSFLFSDCVYSQKRVIVIPFMNMDGPQKYNIWCYNLQDSVSKALKLADPQEKYYHIIPSDSLDMLTADMNLNPNNPQFISDMLTAVNKLNAQKIISGEFIVDGSKMVINAYIYNPRTKMRDNNFQARDIPKSQENVYESVNEIVDILKNGLMQ